jgi:hypothetical protein
VTRYFFDSRDNETVLKDDDGVELPDLDAVKVIAAQALAELALDILPGSVRRELAVEVRDERGPVLKALMRFEAIILI